MSREAKLIDQIMGEISEKNMLQKIYQITLTKPALEELKANYSEEFKMELRESKRTVSVRDLEDYFGVPVVVSTFNNDEKYQLLKKI